MSKRRSRRNSNKPDHVQSAYYDPFMNNPVRNKQVIIENMYVRVITELSCNRFRWSGLPNTVDERFLELTLFRQALCIFFKDEGPGSKNTDRFFAMRGTGVAPINMYDNPTQYRVLGNGQMERTLGAKDCVPIWANYLRTPDWDIVQVYATKLANIDRTIEITLDQMRTPYIATIPESQRLSWTNIMKQKTEGEGVIWGTSDLDVEKAIQFFPLTVEKDQVLNLQLAKAKMWNECMTLLGINNANQDKKERLISGEVDANNGQVMASRSVALTARRQAAERINDRYGLAIDVEWNEEASTSLDADIKALMGSDA